MKKKCYLYEGERLVFEGMGWGIIIDDGSADRSYVEGFVYGTHQECTVPHDADRTPESDERDGYSGDERYSYGENCWEPVDDPDKGVAKCAMCNADVPEGVQALILMQAWAGDGETRHETKRR